MARHDSLRHIASEYVRKDRAIRAMAQGIQQCQATGGTGETLQEFQETGERLQQQLAGLGRQLEKYVYDTFRGPATIKCDGALIVVSRTTVTDGIGINLD
jgi:hypothetical protein